MKKVVVVMSTYNGGNRIVKQLDSIFAQKGVDVVCYVRDDGSRLETKDILREYSQKQPGLTVDYSENVGWQRSFLYALEDAPSGDYYAFSDQDDVWMPEKLLRSVEELDRHDNQKALLFHCNRISCNEELIANAVQAPKVPHPLNWENALTQEYAQGCSVVINGVARELVCRHLPKVKVPHDFWTGLICYCFGKVYYSEEQLFYHINHGGNASTAGHIRASQKQRLRGLLGGKGYDNVAADLLEGYGDVLTAEQKKWLRTAANAKHSIADRLRLLFNPRFKRVNASGTLMLKIAVMMGKF